MRDLRIPAAEIERRRERLRDHLAGNGHDGVVVFDPVNVQYLSNFYSVPTQRPVALALSGTESRLVVPEQDVVHAEAHDDILYDELRSYYEYPQSDPMSHVAEACADLGIATGSVAVDADGPGNQLGYYGPALSDVVDAEVTSVSAALGDLRRYKSEPELALYREGARWATLAHRELQDAVATGRRPVDVSGEVEASVTHTMLDALCDRFRPTGWASPVQAAFTAGPGTAFSHNFDVTRRVRAGDPLMSLVMVEFDNYWTGKLERTMLVEGASDEARHYFEVMREAQELLFEALEPGVPYARAEEVVDDYLAEHGLVDAQDHRPGHGMGLSWLELPLLDRGLEGEISEGEVFTIEPGIYVEGVGGFRHCDTVVAVDGGLEFVTDYPRDIESLTVPAE